MTFERLLDEFTRRDWETDEGDGEPVRFALVGLGWFTRDIVVPAIEATDACTTSVVVSGSRGKAEEVSDEADADRALSYDEFHEGEAADAYDAVYICTPNALHLPYAETAADLGKHVLCEKPMEATADRAERMVDACSDVTLMVAYRMQFDPTVRRMRELIEAGVVGEPVLVDGSMCQDIFDVIGPDPDQWRLDADLSGGAALIDLGVYPLNTARFVLGEEPVRARGETSSTHEAFDGVDERVSFSLAFESGAVASCFASQRARLGSHFTVTGTEGRLTLDPAFFGESALEVESETLEARFDPQGIDEVAEEFAYFAQCVRTGEDPTPDGAHGLRDMRIVEAIYGAAETGAARDL